MRKSLYLVTALAFALGGSSACASKGFVKNEVSQVSSKVDSLSQSLEQTQERTKQNESKIAEVDTRTGAAQGAADHAQNSANEADSKAVAAGDAAKAASAKADEVDKNAKRLLYTVVLSEDEGGFKFNKTELPDEAKAKIDELVNQIKADPKGAYFEIEGHTDNVGAKDVNERIGMERAQAVAKYLYEQHQIPLHRINVISYGEDKPVAPNTTKDGRSQNRRIVIKVLV
jgi:peptidoglycan-associated lipoprotein